MTDINNTRELSRSEKGLGASGDKASDRPSVSHISIVQVGREHLSDTLAPHESYEGRHRWDPSFTWDEAEERRVVRKTDLFLLSWLCVMVSILKYPKWTLLTCIVLWLAT